MSEFFIRRAICLVIILSLYKVSLTTKDIRQEFLSQVVSRLVQPASLALWTDESCGIHLDVGVIKARLKEHNTTFIYQKDMTASGILRYITKVSLRSLRSYVHLYIVIDMCVLADVTRGLEALQRGFRRVNVILCSGSIFQVTSGRQVFCSTLQLISAPERNATLLGLPEKKCQYEWVLSMAVSR